MSREIMQQAFDDLVMAERHLNNAETRYWCNQYKQLAHRLLKELAKPEQEPTLFFGRAVYFADPKTGDKHD
ncbi:hypothetical protein UFOVP20_21 [uncultured Caudovirales phage]|uniref:Uncharacterized protein n=1 Tax=uncultured Caudovirales phage TaxID=2100421 RepID=A0A6J5KIE2_9CAUD|nr:hypothetical protein UFOVP20_21 [uncultured Caudovirales phage]